MCRIPLKKHNRVREQLNINKERRHFESFKIYDKEFKNGQTYLKNYDDVCALLLCRKLAIFLLPVFIGSVHWRTNNWYPTTKFLRCF